MKTLGYLERRRRTGRIHEIGADNKPVCGAKPAEGSGYQTDIFIQERSIVTCARCKAIKAAQTRGDFSDHHSDIAALAESYGVAVLLPPQFDFCALGVVNVGQQKRMLYSTRRVIKNLMDTQRLSRAKALTHFINNLEPEQRDGWPLFLTEVTCG